ncbi:hypothetical protein DACRYDRAFT_21739 [Dacryopinax primogenitus]|uniref:Myb-like domain-containing protein n=1 Tax=Dacryopinax primogenitus (strain DJM 731) TaxID=1858805 RepID=M5FXM5_DACPD|nr:uncharacterized protein DACRYDRAFT_21739 [Dacryopinax primogenitus]EJU02776.1 hypothetical protein DACRYDRAFT_21739 [Dacryopinax primogenitus]
MSDHNTPPVAVITRPDGESFTIIDQHYEQLRADRESLNLYRSRAANYREAADKLLEAARLLEEECRPIEDRLSKTRQFCQASLSDSPPSDRASSVLSTVQQLASEALPVVQQLPAYNQGLTNGNGAVYPRHMGLQYVNAPATPPSPHREHQPYVLPERHHTHTPVSAQSYATPNGQRPLKRSRSMVEEDELEEDRKSSPRSLTSTDGMVMKMMPHEQNAAPARKQGKFTDDDRHKIAAYLATTTSRAQNGGIDWKQFALSNPKYDATGWRTQYHSRKHKIDPLIEHYRPQQAAHGQSQFQQPAQQPYVTGHGAHTPSVTAQPSPPSAYAQPAPAYAQPEQYAKIEEVRPMAPSVYAAPELEREEPRGSYAPSASVYAHAAIISYASHSPAATPEPQQPRLSDARDEPMEDRDRDRPREHQHQHEYDVERDQDHADGPPAPPIATVSVAESS